MSTNEDLDFEARLRRQQKRSRIISVVIVVGVLGGVALAYLLWPKAAEPRCAEDKVRYFIKDKRLPAGLVGECCRFPDPMHQALRELAAVPPRHRKLVVFKLAAEQPSLFSPVCPGYLKALAATAQVSLDKQTATFLERCDLSRAGFASAGTLATVPVERLLLAMAVYTSLRKSDPKWARLLAREVCCAGRP